MKEGPDTYAHRLAGDCRCGVTHGSTTVAVRAITKAAARRRPTKIVATFDYHDANGVVQFQTVKTDPKDFFQRRPDPKRQGEWINNLQGVDKTLPWGLPQLLTADPAATVYITEGEKDAERLRDEGLVATTNALGAGNWTPAHAAWILGRTAVALEDNDAEGRKRVEKVAATMPGTRILALPGLEAKGADVSDWLDAGHTVKELIELAADAPIWEPPSAKRASEMEPNDLPQILGNRRNLRESTAEGMTAIIKANEPPVIFSRLGSLARVRVNETGRPVIDALTENMVTHRLANVADWWHVTSTTSHEDSPPPAVSKNIMAMGEWPDLPGLKGIVECPTLRPDFSILDTPGYDPSTRLIYVPNPDLVLPAIPATPTREELAHAIGVIADVFADFPFVDQSSRAAAWAALFTALIRPAVAGHVQMCLFDSPKSGTGKGLLCETIALIVTGRAASMFQVPTKDDEWRKKITTELLAGATLIVVDNIELPLDSPYLASVITAHEWNDRRLGLNESINVPNNAVFFGTGNNISIGGDLPRRCYPCRIDAKVVRPEERNGFRHEHLEEYVAENRGKLIAAALTIVRSWYLAGEPDGDAPLLGSFREWCRIVGGIVAHAGQSGFLANVKDMHGNMASTQIGWEGFIVSWYDALGSELVTTDNVKAALGAVDGIGDPIHPDFRQAVPDELAGELTAAIANRQNTFNIKLGLALKKRVDIVFPGDLVLKQAAKTRTSVQRWQVINPGDLPGNQGHVDLKNTDGTAKSAGDVQGVDSELGTVLGVAGGVGNPTRAKFSMQIPNGESSPHPQQPPALGTKSTPTPSNPQRPHRCFFGMLLCAEHGNRLCKRCECGKHPEGARP